MENLKIAIELESHAKEYFTSLADKCHYNEGVRYILSMLANEQSLLINTIENRIKNISGEFSNLAEYDTAYNIISGFSSMIGQMSRLNPDVAEKMRLTFEQMGKLTPQVLDKLITALKEID